MRFISMCFHMCLKFYYTVIEGFNLAQKFKRNMEILRYLILVYKAMFIPKTFTMIYKII